MNWICNIFSQLFAQVGGVAALFTVNVNLWSFALIYVAGFAIGFQIAVIGFACALRLRPVRT